jgi:acyl-phosphate glycerol 3-phosphate acyltransferase
MGTFPTADIVARYAAKSSGESKVIDLRAAGTGNPGALNAAKMLGWKWGAIVLAGDIVKGALASISGRAIAGDNGAYAAGSGAVVGHCAPVWTDFRGGKGLATSAGTSLVCFPAYMPIDLGLAAGTMALSRGRAGIATYIASGVFIAAALYWWRAGKANLWGPRPTLGLPAYAISSSAIIIYRFLTAPPQSITAETSGGQRDLAAEAVVAS